MKERMPAPLFISLGKEEDSTLSELSVANGVAKRIYQHKFLRMSMR